MFGSLPRAVQKSESHISRSVWHANANSDGEIQKMTSAVGSFLQIWRQQWELSSKVPLCVWTMNVGLCMCVYVALCVYVRMYQSIKFLWHQYPRRSQAQWRNSQIRVQMRSRWSRSVTSTGSRAHRCVRGEGQVEKVCFETSSEGGNPGGWTHR